MSTQSRGSIHKLKHTHKSIYTFIHWRIQKHLFSRTFTQSKILTKHKYVQADTDIRKSDRRPRMAGKYVRISQRHHREA